MNNLKHLSIYGDSILKGIVLNRENMRYKPSASFDLNALAAEYGLELQNYSKFGCTVKKGYSSVQTHLRRNVPCDVALIELGGNDSNFVWAEVAAQPDKEHLSATPLPLFKHLYEKMIFEMKSKNIIPIICSVPPLCALRYLDWITRDGLSRENILKWLGDVEAIYRYQERYSVAVMQTAWELGCPLVDLRGEFLAKLQMTDYFCDDGIHPNEAGQAIILKAFREQLEGMPIFVN